MNPMTILHLDGSQSDHGGILSVLRALQETTAQYGIIHEVAVHESFVEHRTPSLTYRRIHGFVGDHSSYLRMVVSGVRTAIGIRTLLQSRRFDILHGHSRSGWLVGWILAGKVPANVVLTNHTYARRVGFYRKAMAKHAVTPVLLTPQMARHYGVFPEREKVRLISACCSDRFFESPLKGAQKSKGRVQLVGVGTLVRWKRWHLIVEAIARLPGYLRQRLQVTVYGPTEKGSDSETYAEELLLKVQQLGLAETVRFPGATNEIQQRVGECDWFILPSRNEPCSVALLEALAMGRPVIASRSGGSIDIVREGETGMLFETDQVESLSEVLGRIATGTQTSAGMEEIRESVRCYSATSVGARYAALYRELVESNRSIIDKL